MIHIRNFLSLGAKIVSILSSTIDSGIRTSKIIREKYGKDVEYYTDLNKLIDQSKPNAISICTPAYLHGQHLTQVLSNKIPIFCEKPLFWDKNISIEDINRNLVKLSSYENKTIFVNTSNIYFLEKIKNEIPKKDLIKNFIFRFYTNGILRGKDIGYDLLPHGLSMLINILGERAITRLEKNITDNSYNCSFNYGDCLVEFNFIQDEYISKELSFDINEKKYIRIQKGDYYKYKVFLKTLDTDILTEIEDPFLTHMRNFIKTCKSNKLDINHDSFNESSYNLKLMGHILLD